MRCGWGVCLKQDPHISQHLRSATVRSFMVVVWHPSPVPSLDMCGRLQIASLIRRTVPRCPHSLLCRWLTPPLFTQALSTFTKTPKPSNICGPRPPVLGCMRERRTLLSIGFDLRACSLSPGLLLCSTTVVILVLLRNTLKSERIGRSYVNPQCLPNHRRYRQSISTSYQQALYTPLNPLSVSLSFLPKLRLSQPSALAVVSANLHTPPTRLCTLLHLPLLPHWPLSSIDVLINHDRHGCLSSC
jgi:hypothetical protein